MSLFWLGQAVPATAQGPRFVEDEGHIVVIEHDGESYDRDTSAGGLNVSPRQRIARELIDTHGDFYDFIVVFTNFEFDRGGAAGFYTNVRNDVAGINLPLVDNGDSFGSPARLQGFIDMGPVSQYRSAPFSLESADPNFRSTLGILAHEVGHRWLAGVRFETGSGPSNALLGRDGAHWSFLLSSDASFLYGNSWESVGGSLYRSVEVQSRFSELDLYLMGFLSHAEVTPLTLLVNPVVDHQRLPELGAEIDAVDVDTVTIDQVIAAEGARSPGHENSQKDFAVAFVFLTAESLLPTARDLEGVELVRSNFMDTFFGLTRGRALVDPDLLSVAPVTPGAMPNTSLATSWLVDQQLLDGRYESHPLTALRDTSSVAGALSILGVRGAPVDDARAWMSARNEASVDYLARAITGGAALPLERLASLRNPDGGFGIAPGYQSDPLDTALALTALADSDVAPELTAVLVAMQLADGSWSSIPFQPGDVMTTAEVALALARAGTAPLSVQNALAWLVARQQIDGGLGDGPSVPYATARALEAFLNGSTPPSAVEGAIRYLQQTQRADGSWNGSVFETASVLQALVPSTSANLAIEASDVRLDSDPPEVGEVVEVRVTVRNRARVAAASFDVQLFDGDPELGGLAIGAPQLVGALAADSSQLLTFSWDTTGFEGPHTLYAIADFAGAISEVSKEDNVATRDVDVLPPLPNLRVTFAAAEPASPSEGAIVTLRARVENNGSAPAAASLVRFYRETPRLGIALGEVAVPALVPGDTAGVTIDWNTTAELGSHTVHAAVDPDADMRERVETDNEASFPIDVRPPAPAQPDLEIRDFALTPGELTELPQDVNASARVVNTGLDPVPSVLVELFQGHPDLGGVAVASTTIAVGGDTGADVGLAFTVATGGTRTFYLRVDASPVIERDLANNLASADLRDLMDVVDVSLEPSSIVLSASALDPGDLLEVDVNVQNTGTRSLGSVAVALFYELSAGSFRLASTLSVPLAPGASETVRLTWTANRSGTVPLELRVDPNDVLSETNELDNILVTSIDVTASSLPNLSVSASDITSLPSVLVEGASAALEATVRNLGDGPAGSFTVRFYAGDPSSNGVLIDTVALGGIAADGVAVAAANWDPVNARGSTLVFVNVDADGTVEEIDELDNLVFRVVDIQGLPELVATSAQLRLTPPFARSGEAVSIDASFTNAGEQASAPMAVEIRLDDPDGGALVASAEVTALDPGARGSFVAEWDTTGVEGEHALYLVLDVRDDVNEQREDNNVVRVPVALQNADVFVAPIFFSPNGDRIQDETVFSYRLSVGSAVDVEIRDGEERTVRELTATSDESASVVWDGRAADGVVAPDGAYFFVVLADGLEVVRRRVVLDTNRSKVVEALGSDLVSLTQLTCPLPGSVSGPAWLPDDGAAYVIVTQPDAANAPDFPVGLYRVSSDGRSVTLVVADETLQGVTFIDARRFSARSSVFRTVSADGLYALVESAAEGIQILDLTSGARTALGHDANASATWTSDGRRVFVRSSTGLFFYDADGMLLDTLFLGDAEAAALSPDDLRIIYRRREESFLRVIDADGDNDRVLASTDATLFFEDLILHFLETYELVFLDVDTVQFAYLFVVEEAFAGPFRININEDTVDDRLNEGPFLGVPSLDRRWEIRSQGFQLVAKRIDGRETRPIATGSSNAPAWSYRDTHISYIAVSSEGCVGTSGISVARSLLNGEADFRLTRLPSSFGVQITGTVADRNLLAYTLDYAPVATPEAFAPIQPPSAAPVVADTITTWIPPAPGDYLVRLTLRDKAGNDTVRLDRIFWDETPPIASLRRGPTYVSPNGDSVQDELLVEYDVIAPANLVFHIRDEDGRSVRAIERNELALGPASFVWDGTDDFGVAVDDGDYVLEVEGASFPVIVDATAPDVAAVYSELYTYADSLTPARLAVDLIGHIVDARLDSWELVGGNGEIVESSHRTIGTDSVDAFIVERLETTQGLDLRAQDHAGNRTVVPLAGPNREVRVVQAKSKTIGPAAPGPAATVGAEFVEPTSSIGYAAQASFPGGLRFVYAAEGDIDLTEIETNRSVSLRAEDLVLGQTYRGHFDADGVTSQELEFTVGPSAIFLTRVKVGLLTNVVMTNTFDEPLVEGRLVRNESDIVKVYGPLPRNDSVSVTAPACGGGDSYVLEATGVSGTVYFSTTDEAYPVPIPLFINATGCLSVDDAGIERQASRDAPVPSEARALVRNELFPAVPESLVLLLNDNGSESEIGRVVGASGNPSIPFDVSTWSEGSYRLDSRAILDDGSELEGQFSLNFFLDQSPPELNVISPPEGGAACLANVDGRDVVVFDVLVRDREIRALDVELLLDDGTWTSVGSIEQPLYPAFAELERTFSVIVPDGLSGDTTFRWTARNARITDENPERPAPKPPPWPNLQNNGGLVSELVRTVVVSPTLGIGPLATVPSNPALFSPNADGVADDVRVSSEGLEAVSVTVRVFTAAPSPVLLRTVTSELPVGVGAFDIVWDGRDDGGSFVPDGEYDIEVEALNGCGGVSTDTIRVEVDNTPPTVAIDNLVDDQPVAIAVEIEGVATDEHFESYVLEHGEGAAPLTFTEVMPPVTRRVRTSDTLGNWSLGGLTPGIHTLRLSAADVVGNRASTDVRVEVLVADFLDGYQAVPTIFSPNGDDVQDESELSFGLEAEARVTLSILDGSDALVTTLIDGDVLPAGPHIAIWIGLGVADGDYVASLRAEDPTVTTLFEESRITLSLDTLAPAIVIGSPGADSFVSLPAVVNGSITDDHIARYNLEVGPAAGALTPLAEDSVSVTGALAQLPRLADGPHRLRVVASDTAGNRSELEQTFDIDSTPPTVALSAPVDGSFITRVPGDVAVKGGIEETNLDRYDVELGFGDPPSAPVRLAGGTTLPADPEVATWALESLPDGPYTLRLSASDKAANVAMVETTTTLDTTLPAVAIDVPEAGAFVSEPLTVSGSLSDIHFLKGALLVAPAARPEQLTEIGTFETSVAAGELLSALALADGSYILELRAEDLAGNTASATTPFTVDTQPPEPASDLVADVEGTDVTLDFGVSPSLDVVGYHVERDGVRITSAPIPQASYFDAGLDEGIYRYIVVAVDEGGLESEPTEVANATVDLTPPLTVLRSPKTGERVRVEVDVIGTAFAESDFFEYRLNVAPIETPASPVLLKRSSLPVSFDTLTLWQPLVDGDYILTLEAEDKNGNIGEDSVRVTVDNAPPDAPLLVRADVVTEDIEVEWSGPSDTDVDGFLVYRNGEIANASGTVSGSLRPFLVPGPTYVDMSLPDGDHCYRVVAMDGAGNLSNDSNQLCAFLDNRAPAAAIVDPESGARFDAPRTLRAVSEDLDIATVSFQFQVAGTAVWTEIADDNDGEPFEVLWDIAGLAFGDYRLRAVATDIGTRSDPAPAFIDVVLGDATPPAVPQNFTARTAGDDVVLDWGVVTDADLAGYRVFRGDALVLEPAPGASSATDSGVADGTHDYTIRSVDADDNESEPSEAAPARVYAPTLTADFPIVEAADVTLAGEDAEPGATVRLFTAGTTNELAMATTDSSGAFVFPGLTLVPGVQVFEAEVSDVDGNVSRRSVATLLIRNDLPAQPTGFTGSATGEEANLSWSANGEADLSGYLTTRDGVILNRRGLLRPTGEIPTSHVARASNTSDPNRAIGGFSSWSMGATDEEWIEIELAEPRHLEEVRLLWTATRAAKDYDVLVELSGQLVPIIRVRDQARTSVSVHPVPIPLRTTRIRLQIYAGAATDFVFLNEFELRGIEPVTTTSFTDVPEAPGMYDYGVQAIDNLGGKSTPSGPLNIGVGDLTPPEPPTALTATVDTVDVLLVWTASVSPDVVLYRVFRDGEPAGDASATTFTDRDLLNGTYAYHVVAVDAVGNVSGASNVELTTVDVAPPPAPILSVSPEPSGRALTLGWTESLGPLGISSYVVLRAPVTGGPYTEIATVSGATLAFTDTELLDGVELFYVARALDLRGEASELSNEVSDSPEDLEPPLPPFWVAPDSPQVVMDPLARFVGGSEPASTVDVFRDGIPLSTVTAADEFVPVASALIRSSGNVAGRFAMSPNGASVAEVGGHGSSSTFQVRLYDLRTGDTRIVPYEEDRSFERDAAFSPSARRLAVSSTLGQVVRSAIRVLDLDTEITEVLELTEAPNALAWISEDELAVVVGGDEIRVFDLLTDTETTIYTRLSGFEPANLMASPDGAFLAWTESDDLYVMTSAGGAPNLVVDAVESNERVWVDSRTLAYKGMVGGAQFYDVDAMVSTPIDGTEDLSGLRAVGASGVVSAFDGSNLVWVFADGSRVELGEPPDSYAGTFIEWGSGLALAGVTNRFRLTVVESPGRFVLEGELVPGLNVITARATDAAGQSSADSDPLELSYDTSGLADLTVDGALIVIPSAPVTGDAAVISVPVLNQGESGAAETFLTVSGADLDGTLYAIGTAPVPSLASGASASLSVSWETAGRIGPQSILAEVDPLGRIPEADEDNNRQSAGATVVGTAGLELAIATGRARYAAGQVAELTVSAVNGGGGRDIVLETVVEDLSGAPIASVDTRAVNLSYAGSTRYEVFWSAGSVIAGSYVARVRALAGTATVAAATAEFEITRTVSLTLDVVSDRAAYEQGDAVTLFGRVVNVGSNSPLRDLSLRYLIVGPSSTVVFETTQAIGYLAMGGSTSGNAVWKSGANDPGAYTVSVEALEGVELVALGETGFEMADASSVRLSGGVTLDAGVLPAESDILAAYAINNLSVAALTNGTVRVELFDPAAASVVALAEGALNLAASDSTSGELRINTAGLEPGGYSVVLSAGAGTLRTLASVPVTLFQTPAAPSLNAPGAGATAPQRLLLSVNNATNPNAETLTYDFELYVDSGLTILVASASGLPEGAKTTAWSVLQFLEENRDYSWRARAKDRFATSDWMTPANVRVDSVNEAPGAPTLSAPAEASEVAILRPALAIGNANDPEGDVLTYTFELYRDSGLTDLAHSASGVVETVATTTFTPSEDLTEDTTYYWRARGEDGALDGEWMTTASFRVNTANQAPTAPSALAPIGGAVATLSPELIVSPGIDPESDVTTHEFQIDVTDSFDSPERQDVVALDAVQWTPPGALVENGIYFWRSRAADAFAAGPWSDTVSFLVDTVNEPPQTPTPQRPGDNSVVESVTPVLAVVNALDPENDALTYTFEVYADATLTDLVASVATLREGAAETAWAVTPRLAEEETYYWVAYASDGENDGKKTQAQSFLIHVMNEEPAAPALVSPLEGAVAADVAPTLVVSNASDPDGNPLTYLFEVYDDELLTAPPLDSSGEIVEGAGATTSWTMSAPLVENAAYYWRVRAFDGRLDGAWMATARFRFSLENEAPSSPVPIAPADGDVVAELRPTLVITASTDPEEDAVRYAYEVFRDEALTDRVVRSPDVADTSWRVELNLEENGTFYWHAIASDGDLESAPSASFRFTVNVVDEPPSVPILLTPSDGASVDTTEPTLIIANASSPDGDLADPLVYHFAVYVDVGLTDILAEDVAVAEGSAGQTRWEPPVTLNPGLSYYWRARAVDPRGLVSDWATAFSFIVEPPSDDCPPEWRDDFERYPNDTTPTGWRLETERRNPRFWAQTVAGSTRLVSSRSGRGSLLFAGNGEAFDWRNYEFEGEVRDAGKSKKSQKSQKSKKSKKSKKSGKSSKSAKSGKSSKDHCTFATGVMFYAQPSQGSAYRLELTQASCKRPQGRIIKIASGQSTELARIDLDGYEGQQPLQFHIKAVNLTGGTSIGVRLRGRVDDEDREWALAFEDTDAPLRGGTVGAWSNSAPAAWDDFHVSEVQGFSSGLSGDADGDGVCDVDIAPTDTVSCGAIQEHAINQYRSTLLVHHPGLEPASFRLRLNAIHVAPIRAAFPDGTESEIDASFGWSQPVELTLSPGTHEIRLTPEIYVHAFRLEPICR